MTSAGWPVSISHCHGCFRRQREGLDESAAKPPDKDVTEEPDESPQVEDPDESPQVEEPEESPQVLASN